MTARGRRRREWQDERYAAAERRGTADLPPAIRGNDTARGRNSGSEANPAGDNAEGVKRKPLRVYPYGIGQNRLRSAASSLNVPVSIVDNLSGADVVMTLKNYYRQQPQPLMDAERRNVPIYILRSNTVTQMEQCLANIYQLPTEPHGCLYGSHARDAGRHSAGAERRCRRRAKPAFRRDPQPAASVGAGGEPGEPLLWARTVPSCANLPPLMRAANADVADYVRRSVQLARIRLSQHEKANPPRVGGDPWRSL